MRNLRLVIAYDGAPYAGWQRQPAQRTVQGTIEEALAQITQAPCQLRGAGRTDAGVHALGQLANFRTESSLSCDKFRRGLNALLPESIRISRLDEVPSHFDARRHNEGKHYRYAVWNAEIVPPGAEGWSAHLRSPLDLRTICEEAALVVGRHDFAAFRAADCDRTTTTRTIYRCTIAREGALVSLDVEGEGFLKHMVRILAGTLLDIGRGRLARGTMARLLSNRDRRDGGTTAPPRGLCLVRVFDGNL